MQISEFSTWLDNLLEPKMFKDYCVDGLCVEASDKVTRIVTGVSFRGKFGERMRRLMQNGISLYGFHLPLDGHMEVGNNVLIAKAYGLQNIEGFLREGERTIGVVGEFAEPVSSQNFVDQAKAVFEHGVQHALMYGKPSIKKLAVCSGSAGAPAIEEAMALGCDAFVTGEIKEAVPIACEELGFNLISCGHHRTEIFGVRALAAKIQAELGIPATFIDIDNEV